jgi:hypothetical protein
MNDPRKPDKFHASADELAHNEEMKTAHDAPIKSVTELIEGALRRVLKSLGVDVGSGDEIMKHQQIERGIIIAERPLEEMGVLAGFYVIDNEVPIAIVRDPYMGSDGLAYVDIYWIQGEQTERFGGIRIIQ